LTRCLNMLTWIQPQRILLNFFLFLQASTLPATCKAMQDISGLTWVSQWKRANRIGTGIKMRVIPMKHLQEIPSGGWGILYTDGSLKIRSLMVLHIIFTLMGWKFLRPSMQKCRFLQKRQWLSTWEITCNRHSFVRRKEELMRLFQILRRRTSTV